MSQRIVRADEALRRLEAAARAVDRPVAFMEVCGTHTVNAFRCGLHSLMPSNVTLLSGPGCPVCVTAQGDIDALIGLASESGVILCTYGDMLRVPGASGNLEAARGRGADVRVIYSALDAVKLAETMPQRRIVLAAVGFETTTPATAIAILEAEQRHLRNFTVLASHKRIIPAMGALLASGRVQIDGSCARGTCRW
jgi:hydrogenase expression/formation protein HypD